MAAAASVPPAAADAVFRKATKSEFPELAATAMAASAGGLVTPVAFPAMPVVNAAVVYVPDKRALLIGGYSATQATSLNQTLDYDFTTKQWSTINNPLPSARSDHTAGLVAPNAVVVFGGWDDRACLSQTLLLKATPAAASAAGATTGAPAGGASSKNAAVVDPNAAVVPPQIVCDWKTAQWEPLTASSPAGGESASGQSLQPSPRRLHSSCVLFPPGSQVNAVGKFFVFGGFSGTARLGDLWQFSGDSMTWSQVETTGFAPSPRDGASLAADHANQRLFLFGGYTCNRCDDLYLFDVAASVWTRVAHVAGAPSPRFGAFSAVWAGYAVVGLGQDAKGASSTIAQYHLSENKWSQVAIEGDEVDGRIHTTWGLAEGGKKVLLFGGTNEKKYSTSLIEIDLERTEAPAAAGKGGKK